MKYLDKRWITLVALVVLAVFLRGYRFSAWSIDVDEAFTPWECNQVSAGTLANYFTFHNREILDSHLTSSKLEYTEVMLLNTYPLYYMLTKSTMILFHTSEAGLRVPSVAFGILSVLLLYVTVLRLFNYRTAVIACMIALFHPLIQFHSQNARFYSILFFSALLIVFMTYKIKCILSQEAITRRSKVGLVILGVCLWLPMMVHMTAVFVYILTFLVIIDVLVSHRENIRPSLYLFVPAVVVSIFVFGNQFIFLTSRLGNGITDAAGVHHMVVSTLGLVNNFGLSLFAVLPISIYVAVMNKNRMLMYFLITVLLSLACYMVASFKNVEIRDDYLFPILPIMIVAVASGIDELFVKSSYQMKYDNIAVLTAVVLIIVSFLPAFISTTFIDGDRCNWKEASKFINDLNEHKPELNAVNILCQAPGNIEFYSSKYSRKYNCAQIGAIENTNLIPDDSFVIIPIRRGGMDTRRITDDVLNYVYKNGRLLKIIGKDRLDNHLCKLAVYEMGGL